MISRVLVASATILSLGVTSAWAGGRLAGGPISTVDSNVVACAVMNVGTKDVSEVVVSIYKAGTAEAEASVTCNTLAPNDLCAVQSLTVGSAFRSCVVTLKGSSKSLRGTFCDYTFGQCDYLR